MITPNENIAAENRMGSREAREVEMFRTSIDKPFARVSWGAIFAGALTALSVLLILSLVGLGIGLSTLDPATADNPSGTAIGVGAVIWWMLSNVLALFAGGYVCGRLAGNFNGWLHGVVTWSAVTIMTVMLLSSAIGRAFSGVSGLAQFAAQTVPNAPGVASQISGPAQNALNQIQGAANDPAARARAEQQAREVGQQAARGGAMGSFGAALALLLGAGAAAYGGMLGKRRFLDVVPERKEFLVSSRA